MLRNYNVTLTGNGLGYSTFANVQGLAKSKSLWTLTVLRLSNITKVNSIWLCGGPHHFFPQALDLNSE